MRKIGVKLMRISIAALRGFNLAEPDAPTYALLMEGDETVLTFTKRDAYAGWTTDDTKIITDEGETTIGESNVPVPYTHLLAHDTKAHLLCRLSLDKKKTKTDS